MTCDRLSGLGIECALITLSGLARGPGLSSRARQARHDALEAGCRSRGIVHLLFGHHAADQAETVLIRMLARSSETGLAGMAALVEARDVRKLRPLLGVAPGALRIMLRTLGVAWVEDPSNADPGQLRARLRMLRADPAGDGAATRALVMASAARGRARAGAEASWQTELGCRAAIFPQGYAVLSPGPIQPEALAHLLAMLAGALRTPSLVQVIPLAAVLRAATLAGVRILPAGRLGPGWLLVREQASMAPPVAAEPGAVWDGRFRLHHLPERWAMATDLTIGAWGDDAEQDRAGLPNIVLRTLPVLRQGGMIVSAAAELLDGAQACVRLEPRRPATSAPFLPLLPICE